MDARVGSNNMLFELFILENSPQISGRGEYTFVSPAWQAHIKLKRLKMLNSVPRNRVDSILRSESYFN